MPISNQVRWIGVAPIDPPEDIPVKVKRPLVCQSYLAPTTVGPNSSVDVVSISGSGIIIGIYQYADTVAPDKARMEAELDGVTPDPLFTVRGIDVANRLGRTSVGVYQDGRSVQFVQTWDTSGNVYVVWCYNLSVPFNSSCTVRVKNLDSSLDSTMEATVVYAVHASSRISAWEADPQRATDPHEIREALKDGGLDVDAVILDWIRIQGGESFGGTGLTRRLLVVSNDYIAKRLINKVEKIMIEKSFVKRRLDDFQFPRDHTKKHAYF